MLSVIIVVEGKADPAEMGTLRDLMSHLSVCVVSKKNKNVEVLHIAAEVSDISAIILRLLSSNRIVNQPINQSSKASICKARGKTWLLRTVEDDLLPLNCCLVTARHHSLDKSTRQTQIAKLAKCLRRFRHIHGC